MAKAAAEANFVAVAVIVIRRVEELLIVRLGDPAAGGRFFRVLVGQITLPVLEAIFVCALHSFS